MKTAIPHGRFAVMLHWFVACWLIGMVLLDWTMIAIEDEPGSAWYFRLHKSLGLVALALVLARMSWRASVPPAACVPRWQARVAALTQGGLYLGMLALPVSGLVFFGQKIVLWSVSEQSMAEKLFSLHTALVWGLLALLGLHLAAALKHLLRDKDGAFQRMWV